MYTNGYTETQKRVLTMGRFAVYQVTSAPTPCYRVREIVTTAGEFIVWDKLYGTIDGAVEDINTVNNGGVIC